METKLSQLSGSGSAGDHDLLSSAYDRAAAPRSEVSTFELQAYLTVDTSGNKDSES